MNHEPQRLFLPRGTGAGAGAAPAPEPVAALPGCGGRGGGGGGKLDDCAGGGSAEKGGGGGGVPFGMTLPLRVETPQHAREDMRIRHGSSGVYAGCG